MTMHRIYNGCITVINDLKINFIYRVDNNQNCINAIDKVLENTLTLVKGNNAKLRLHQLNFALAHLNCNDTQELNLQVVDDIEKMIDSLCDCEEEGCWEHLNVKLAILSN